MDNSPTPIAPLPIMEVEQPKTFRIFRLLVDEVLPPQLPAWNQQMQGQGLQNSYGNPKQTVATIADFVRFAALLSPEDKAQLKAVL